MFGALMGTLSSFQKATRGNAKMGQRAEIEARVKEKVQREKEELGIRKERMEEEKRVQEEELLRRQKEEKVCNPNVWRCTLYAFYYSFFTWTKEFSLKLKFSREFVFKYCFFAFLFFVFGRLFPLISFISMDINDSPIPIPNPIYVSFPSFPNKS